MLEIKIAEGVEARKKILRGAARVGKIVGMSLGPRGRNAIIKTHYSPPQILNDGVTIARNIMLDDDIEDLGAQTLIEGSMKTDARAGDGTTSTVVLASKIVEEYAKKIEDEDKAHSGDGTLGDGSVSVANVNLMAREILDVGAETIEKLKKMSHPLKKNELKNVISTSLGQIFPEYIDSLTEIIQETGKDGYVSVEDNWLTKYGLETETIKGMRFEGTYATPYMANTKRKEAVYEDVFVLVCNHDLASLNQFRKNLQDPKSSFLFDLIQSGKRKVVIIANKFERPLVELLAATVMQARKGNTDLVDFLAIKAPAMTSERMEDIATFCGADFFDKNRADIDIKNASVSNLGFVKKIVVNEDEVMMIGGNGSVKERMKLLKEQLDVEKDSAFKNQLLRRIGALQSGFAVIRVGAATDGERVLMKKKIEDAVNSAKNALEEGVVSGGGLALKEIAEELGEKHPMYWALRAPYDKIQESAGGKLKISDSVIDPLKIVRIAVETACSVAASLITVEVGLAERRKGLWDELEEKLDGQRGVRDDFRDDENQDQRFK